MKNSLKGKKMIFIAIAVIILGVFIIGGIKIAIDKVNANKEEKYVCSVSTELESNAFSVNYKGGLPEMVKLSVNIKGPKEFTEDGEKNESEERKDYEAHVTSIYLTYNAYNSVKGFTVNTKEEDGVFNGEITLDYNAVDKENASGLFASKDEKIDHYIKRLEEVGYSCELKKD